MPATSTVYLRRYPTLQESVEVAGFGNLRHPFISLRVKSNGDLIVLLLTEAESVQLVTELLDAHADAFGPDAWPVPVPAEVTE